jgi:hypothetical protein
MAGKRTTVQIAAAIIAPVVCALGILGAIGSFATIRHLAIPWFGSSAWIVPVGIDLGIAALLAWDLLAEYTGLPWPVLRWAAWAFIAATVYLNISAADGDLTAAIMHVAMPTLFVIVVEGIRHLIRQYTGLANGTRIERIPVARWILAPRSSFLLFRHMVLWHVTSYRTGLDLEYQRWQAISRLQQIHGRYLWRWRAPLSDRLALRPAPVLTELVLAAIPAAEGNEIGATKTPAVGPDTELIATAKEIVREARRPGVRLSQAALGRKLRERGLAIANERLRWLMSEAERTELPGGASCRGHSRCEGSPLQRRNRWGCLTTRWCPNSSCSRSPT